MEKKPLPNKNPWINLSTVTNFDKGSSLFSKKSNKELKKNKNIKTLTKTSYPSIFLNTLISQLCKFVEKDSQQSKKLHSFLSDTMVKMKLFDSFNEFDGFENAQGKYMNAILQLINVAKSIVGSDTSVPYPRSFISSPSQYQDQFTETGFIASGGFGSVYKAVHKLDEVEYAIKKIIVKLGKMKNIMTHLEEVKTLAKLNHENIVSYKQAWIEPITTNNVSQLKLTEESKSINTKSKSTLNKKKRVLSKVSENSYNVCSTSHKNSKFSCKSKNSYFTDKTESVKSFKSSDSSLDIIFLKEDEKSDVESDLSIKEVKEQNSKNSDSSSDIIFEKENETSYQESDTSNSIERINSKSSSEESNSSEESSENRVCQYSSSENQYAVLYIQMTLCEKTLRHWLDERKLEPTPIATINSIAKQIVCGLNYIHSLKIVHHDIKPSNIFISTSGKLKVQLGDFGLACPLQRDSHSTIIGTSMYAAPEQLQGECNPKSDIYSLGIVLLELLVPMSTYMECIKMVQSFRKGEIPSSLVNSHPKWAYTISQLIQLDPKKRPSTDRLIKDLIVNEDLTKLQYEYYLLQTDYNKLQDENEKKDRVIEALEKKLASFMNKIEKKKK